MRLVVIAVLLGGCNQIFGLDETNRVPDAGTPDALWSRSALSQQIAVTASTVSADPELQYAMIPDADVAVATRTGAFATVPYVAASPKGNVEVPPEIIEAGAWRLAWTPPGEVPHELQWSAAFNVGDVTTPVFGRLERKTPPANSGYRVLTNYSFGPRTDVYTTGYWSKPAIAPGMTMMLAATAMTPLSGPAGAPEQAAGDLVVVIENEDAAVLGGTCRRVNKFVTFPPGPLFADNYSDAPATVNSTGLGRNVTVRYLDPDVTYSDRLKTALGTRHNPAQPPTTRVVFGRTPHLAMPMFTSRYNNAPAPILIPLVECPTARDVNDETVTANFTDVNPIAGLPGVVFGYANFSRSRNGVQLVSSLSTVVHDAALAGTFVTDFRVPLAIAIALDTTDLAGDSDANPVPTGAMQAELTFAVEPGLTLDYFEVVLHRFDGATLVPVRKLIGADPTSTKVTLDLALLTPGVEYVFSIHTYRGRPNIATAGDFTRSVLPQVTGVIFTRTFIP